MDEWQERVRELEARRVERRRFLQGMLGLSGLAVASGTPLARALVKRSAGTLPSVPAESGLDTIVVGMMENRSLDHFLGWLPGIDGVQEGFANPKKLVSASGCPTGPLDVSDAAPVPTYKIDGDHCQSPDPNHSWDGSRIEFNAGRLNGFADRSGTTAMGYFGEQDVPFLAWLAREYTPFSRYHCSVMGPTYPNREYLHSAQAGGVKGNSIPFPPQGTWEPVPGVTQPDLRPTGYKFKTIWESLNEAGVPWAYYGSDLPTIALFFHNIYENPGKVRHITDYFVDAAAGTLPNVVFIDPSFITIGNDDHPAHDIKLGQRFMMDTFLALAQGPQWSKSAYILTYDEHGGFFDHVPPPRTADDRANLADPCNDWGQLGFRVPTVVASPFSRPGFIGSNLYDHTSILKLIEWRFSLSPLTKRDAAANNIGEVLDFENPRVGLPSEPPFIPIHTAGFACAQGPTESRHDTLEAVPDLPVPALATPDIEPPHAEMLALAEAGFFGKLDMRERARHGVFRA